MSIFTDPKFLNYVILVLYFVCSVRWLYEKNYGQALYWIGAFILTIAITFMMEK